MASSGSDAEAAGNSSDDGSGGGGGRKVPTLQISPFELRFSQKKMRNVFVDGRLISDTVSLIKVERLSPEEAELRQATYRLEAPFPPIEVLRWRCKLRDDVTGRPLLDPDTGEELMEEEENWFTLDNRRLHCLQQAAVRLLPERCTAAVIAEMPKGARRMREIRKFRTLDSGKSILVGSRVDGVPFSRWNWRQEVGKQAAGNAASQGATAEAAGTGNHSAKGSGNEKGKGKRKGGSASGSMNNGGNGKAAAGKNSGQGGGGCGGACGKANWVANGNWKGGGGSDWQGIDWSGSAGGWTGGYAGASFADGAYSGGGAGKQQGGCSKGGGGKNQKGKDGSRFKGEGGKGNRGSLGKESGYGAEGKGKGKGKGHNESVAAMGDRAKGSEAVDKSS